MSPQDMVAQMRNLPPVSQAALKLVSLLDQPEISNDEVVEVLKHDSVLTAKLLRACNSPALGLAEPVTSVDQAVFILGYNQLLQMVTTLAFGGAMVVPLPGYAIAAQELWRHSLITAAAGELLCAQSAPLAEPATAFTVGLLHDIGKLVLGQFLDEATRQAVRRLIAEGQSGAEAEKAVLGTDHAEVGARLLQLWHVPEELVQAVANHHRPSSDPHSQLAIIAHLANCLAHLAGATPGSEAYAVRTDPQVIQHLALTPEKLEHLLIGVRESFERMDQFMTLT
jgi:putative nucleotidyltransferase with HDIG domain